MQRQARLSILPSLFHVVQSAELLGDTLVVVPALKHCPVFSVLMRGKGNDLLSFLGGIVGQVFSIVKQN
jgi:hypothetical protein